jgi:GAF domain-containing protein
MSEVVQTEYPESQPGQARWGYRSVLAVPLLRRGEPIGILASWRPDVRPFTDRQIELVEAFADQAVIAIENARLFSELEQRTAELSEALTQQTAMGEVLRAIASAPTNLHGVLDTIAEAAARLCDAPGANIQRLDEENGRLYLDAAYGPLRARLAQRRRGEAGPDQVLDGLMPTRGFPSGRAVLERQTIRLDDLATVLDTEYPEARRRQERGGQRSYIVLPLLRQGEAIGTLSVARFEVRPFTDREVEMLETFADQAVIAIENARLFEQLEQRNHELQESNRQVSEALDQQTATARVLETISRAPTDLQTVLDTIVESAARLCGAADSVIGLVEESGMRLIAGYGPLPKPAIPGGAPLPLDRQNIHGRIVQERRPIQVIDPADDPEHGPGMRTHYAEIGVRVLLGVPMLRGDEVIGDILLRGTVAEPFNARQVALLETFADQAVIAIGNTRLFEELEQRNAELADTLEQQTALAEVLRVLSSSPDDLAPVFSAILERATRLCDARLAVLLLFNGETFELAASQGATPEYIALLRTGPIGPPPGFFKSEGPWRPLHVPDARALPANILDDPVVAGTLVLEGTRTQLYVPLVKDGRFVGTILLYRREVRAFDEKHIELVKTFADQAVIAMENVRLFRELQERNADLHESNRQVTEALEQQTATADILRVIASSPTDLQAVLEALITSAVRLCDADTANVQRLEHDGVVVLAATSTDHAGMTFPIAGTVAADVIEQMRTVHAYGTSEEQLARYPASPGARAGLGVQLSTPLLRQGRSIGVISLQRRAVRPFTDREIALLERFADQAVIAIENARLFAEVQERTAQLARSVDELRALGEVGQAVSSSLDLQEVLTTIVSHATRLAGADGGTIYELDEPSGDFVMRASYRMPEELLAAVQQYRPNLKDASIVGEAARSGAARQQRDLLAPGDQQDGPLLGALQRAGFRALIAVPLLREQRAIGMLVIRRKQPGEFPSAVVDLLQTLASQSVLAIENARLFEQIREQSHALEEASQHKSQFLANMSHELRTPLNAVIGYSEMLQEELEDLDQAELVPDVERINAAGRHLLGLINDILDLSKIEAGKMEPFLEPVDVAGLVRDVASTVGPLIEKNGNTLVVDVAPDIGEMEADATQLRQILFNLLGNAAKFTDHGTITLRVARGEVPGDRSQGNAIPPLFPLTCPLSPSSSRTPASA